MPTLSFLIIQVWLHIVAVLTGSLTADDTSNTVWPIPQAMSAGGEPLPLLKSFAIHTGSKSALLHRGIERYSKFIVPGEHEHSDGPNSLAGLTIQVTP